MGNAELEGRAVRRLVLGLELTIVGWIVLDQYGPNYEILFVIPANPVGALLILLGFGLILTEVYKQG